MPFLDRDSGCRADVHTGCFGVLSESCGVGGVASLWNTAACESVPQFNERGSSIVLIRGRRCVFSRTNVRLVQFGKIRAMRSPLVKDRDLLLEVYSVFVAHALLVAVVE